MKATILTIAALLSISIMGGAQNPYGEKGGTKTTVVDGKAVLDDVTVDGVRITHDGTHLVIDMNLELAEMSSRSRRAILLFPCLTSGSDSLEFPAVGIYGRQRYFFNKRNDVNISGEAEESYRHKDRPDVLPYHAIVPYEPWMNGAELSLVRRDYGCCNNLLAEQAKYLGAHQELAPFIPEFIYVSPVAEVEKVRVLEGSAFVDFPVDETVIYPEYRNNRVELAKITETIDVVRNDRDVTITSIWLKGFASPESPYEHNTELSLGRTAAVKDYVQQLYKFDPQLFSTENEPENWEGLRKYVEASNINHREAILEIIDMDREPDPKEWILKSTYPAEYKYLLANCYPALRRTDYRVTYNIRTYDSVEEIRRVLATNPQNLNLNEFYLLAQSLEPGTREFVEVFETAVRMYPNDNIANLNAANTAMKRGDMEAAIHYLDRAGDSVEAVYARGVYAYLNGDAEAAQTCFRYAQDAGIEAASAALKAIAEDRKFASNQ